jgi:aldehyde dehydrogenase (NAD+)
MDNNMEPIDKEIKRVFELQREYKWKLREGDASQRIQKLRRLNETIIKYKDEIINAVYSDFKKPAEEVLMTEILPVTSEIKNIIKQLPKWMKPKKVKTPLSHFGSKSVIRYESRGVSLIISPWNFPFQLAISPLVSAIAAGNCVILKPSEFSPASTSLIKKLLSEVFEEREVAVFEGDYRVSQRLLEKPFDNIFFTGSPAVGKLVMEAAAKNLTTVTLELGGKSPVIIDQSADLEAAAKKIAWGKTLNAGQICVAPDYILVHEEQKVEFISLISKYFEKYYGNMKSKGEAISYCRIINNRHFERIKGLIEDAVNKGAKVTEEAHFDEKDNLIAPMVLSDVPLDSKILEEEIFGPVLPVLTYKTLEEALNYINSKPKPLALYIFSEDDVSSRCILNNTESGDVLINDVILHVANINLPFGGVNNSGIGKSHGYHGFMSFTHERSLMKQGRFSTASMLYPPFKENRRKLIDKMIKYL